MTERHRRCCSSVWTAAVVLLVSSLHQTPATPVLGNVESWAKQYIYNSYPPGNPEVLVSQAITVTETANRLLSKATVIFHNGTKYDDMALASSSKKISFKFYPADGDCQLSIWGNSTAKHYQAALRAVTYKAPLTFKVDPPPATIWKNITFQVINMDGTASNTVTRVMRLDASHKTLTEQFQGTLVDDGSTFVL